MNRKLYAVVFTGAYCKGTEAICGVFTSKKKANKVLSKLNEGSRFAWYSLVNLIANEHNG